MRKGLYIFLTLTVLHRIVISHCYVSVTIIYGVIQHAEDTVFLWLSILTSAGVLLDFPSLRALSLNPYQESGRKCLWQDPESARTSGKHIELACRLGLVNDPVNRTNPFTSLGSSSFPFWGLAACSSIHVFPAQRELPEALSCLPHPTFSQYVFPWAESVAPQAKGPPLEVKL